MDPKEKAAAAADDLVEKEIDETAKDASQSESEESDGDEEGD